jgi:DNA-binding NarL/FixJ family response regulator
MTLPSRPPPSTTTTNGNYHPSSDRPHLIRPLSPRQTEVAELVAKGWKYGAIADELGISTETVRGYVKAIVRLLPPSDGNLTARQVVQWWYWSSRKGA